MRIGVDFDNTLAGYDHLFAEAARGRGWTEVPLDRGKQALRDALRAGPDGENNWRSLQAEVYGARMAEAKLMDGVADFFGHCRERGVTVSIVSHKTRYAAADPDGVDLHTASLDWMRLQGFFGEGFGIDPAQVFFEASRAEKLARIAALECTHFIDDLEEVLLAPEFPKGVKRYLIGVTAVDAPGLTSCGNWRNITEDIFGRNPV